MEVVDDTLKPLTRELVEAIRRTATEWDRNEQVRAVLRTRTRLRLKADLHGTKRRLPSTLYWTSPNGLLMQSPHED